MSDEHWEYWMSFNQPFKFYFLGDDQVLFENIHVEEPHTYIRSYHMVNFDGSLVFEGIIFPDTLGVQIEDNFKDGKVIMKINDTLRKVRF